MIELAPYHKIGLTLANPIMLAAGCAGYGQAYHALLEQRHFGALVTNPITLRPRRGSRQPRLVETGTGLILNVGEQNPGVKKVIRRYARLWPSLAIPVIAHLPAEAPDDLGRTARALAACEAVSAIELALPPDATPPEVSRWLKAIQAVCQLLILVKLPLMATPDVLEAAVTALADALVIGTPPEAATLAGPGQIMSGTFYGPSLFHLVLARVRQVRGATNLPLIAAGGVHSPAEVEVLLAAGAQAVQLDTLLWRDPHQAELIAQHFAAAAV
jgi:dihydroorotate dehydrogenase (NAD+) catalytic subunit